MDAGSRYEFWKNNDKQIRVSIFRNDAKEQTKFTYSCVLRPSLQQKTYLADSNTQQNTISMQMHDEIEK